MERRLLPATRPAADRRPAVLRPPANRLWACCVLVVLAVAAAACGGDDEPELTVEERLSTIAGRQLTQAEVDEQLVTSEMLCRMDDDILDAVWFRLDDGQLEFQDFVFGHVCPERSTFYAGQTGRFVTEEAEGSGVVTSTSRPSATASTTTSTTARRATIAPAPSTTGQATDSGGSASTSSTTVAPGSTDGDNPSTTGVGEGG